MITLVRAKRWLIQNQKDSKFATLISHIATVFQASLSLFTRVLPAVRVGVLVIACLVIAWISITNPDDLVGTKIKCF